VINASDVGARAPASIAAGVCGVDGDRERYGGQVAGPAIRQFVLKVHGRCNLACDYCYVYESVDQSWREKPVSMSLETVHTAAERIREYAETHALPQVGVTLHGGEPLLVGHDGLRAIVDALRAAIGAGIRLDIGMQTNGVLLDEPFARYLLDEGICTGISLDGGRAANDRHRRFAHGGSSFDAVLRAVRLLGSPPYRPVFSGVLATVDPANDPVQLFSDLLALDPGKIDLLLPHATWDSPPPAARGGATVFGDWLVAFFDAWYEAPPKMGVRLFEEIMHALLGGASTAEAVGLSAPGSLVIETDGSFERSDILKVTYAGAPVTGYDIVSNQVDDVVDHPGVRALMRGLAGLSKTCRQCPVVTACGGGQYPHRYRATNGFDNPSVYCRDLGRLINHVSDRIQADLAARAQCCRPVGVEAP
jgi:uncharacterized protein